MIHYSDQPFREFDLCEPSLIPVVGRVKVSTAGRPVSILIDLRLVARLTCQICKMCDNDPAQKRTRSAIDL